MKCIQSLKVKIYLVHILSLWADCRNALLTARLGNRELTVTVQLTCGRVARSMVSKPLG